MDNEKFGFECCGHFWEFKDTQSMDMRISKIILALCLKCGNYKQKETGQIDEEEIESANPYEPELFEQMQKEVLREEKIKLDDYIDEEMEAKAELIKDYGSD